MNISSPQRELRVLPHVVFSCLYHVIFCPKYRRRVLVDGVDKRLKELLVEKSKELNAEVVELEVMPDHVHMLLDVDVKKGVYRTVSLLKGYASRTLREEFPSLRSRLPTLWSRSKFIATCGCVSLEVVKRYIEEQKGK